MKRAVFFAVLLLLFAACGKEEPGEQTEPEEERYEYVLGYDEVGLDVPDPEQVYGTGHFGKYFVCTYWEKQIPK